MIKTKKIISFLFFSLSITLIVVDGSFFVNHANQINTCDTHTDISGHFEQTHSPGSEDWIALNENKAKSALFVLKTDFIPTTEVSFKNSFISTIWQPPKIS